MVHTSKKLRRRFPPPLYSDDVYRIDRTALHRSADHAVSKLPPGARKKQKKRGKKKGGNGQGNANKGCVFSRNVAVINE